MNQTLTLHWDGIRWSAVASPNIGDGPNTLDSVAEIAPDDVWAVGHALSPDLSRTRPLALHWDGTAWSVIPVPRFEGQASLEGLAAVSSNDVWAVGFDQGGVGPFSLRWDGTSWQRAHIPGRDLGVPEGLAANSSEDVWTVGWYWSANQSTDTGFASRWTGSRWETTKLPHAGSTHNYVYDVATISSSDLWAVGNRDDFGRPLALHYAEVCPG